jgi:hypothetical protein
MGKFAETKELEEKQTTICADAVELGRATWETMRTLEWF